MDNTHTPSPTRQRLITATHELLRRKGLHGFGVNEVLSVAGAPKGVLYYHFPGGKQQLATAVIESATENIVCGLLKLRASQGSVVDALRTWLELAHRQLEDSNFEHGCPLATVSLESTAEDQALRQVLAESFERIRASVAHLLTESGLSGKRAEQFALLIVSSYEGSLLQARVANNAEAARVSMELLMQLLHQEIETARK